MKTDNFKFFKGNKKKVKWELTGLLVDAYDPDFLSGVLVKTVEHITTSDSTLIIESQYSMLLIIMTKLFRDKLTSYSPNFIQYKIDEVIIKLRSPEINNYMIEIQQNAWSGVDVEAELTQLIYERCNWIEE